MAPVARYAYNATIKVPEHDMACKSGYSKEKITYRFPEGMQILSVPDPLKVEHELFTYEASYELKERTLTVERYFDDRTPGNICSPELVKQFKEAAKPVLANVRAEVLYKLAVPEEATATE